MAEISSNSRRIAKNTMALYVRMLLSTVVSLYTSRVVLQTLGVEDFGVYGVVGGIVAMFSFLNSTMAGATSRFLSFELGKGDENRLKETFSSALIIHIGIALIVFVLAETIGMWFLCNKLVIPEGRMVAAHWVFQFSILSMAVTVTQVPYNAAIIAHEKMDVYAYVELLHVFLKLGIVYLLVIGHFDKLILYAFLVLVVQIIVVMTYLLYCLKHYRESHFVPRANKEISRRILSFSIYNLFGNMGSVVNTQGTAFVINIFFGVVYNAAAAIGTTISGVVTGFASNVMTAFRPQIIKAYAQDDIESFQSLLMWAIKSILLIYAFVAIPVGFTIKEILSLWLVEVPIYTDVFCQLLLISIFFETLRYIIIMGIHATGKVKLVSLSTGILFCVNPFIIYLLYRLHFSPAYAYISVIGANIMLSVLDMFILKHNEKRFLLNDSVFTLLRVFAAVFVVVAISYLMCSYKTGRELVDILIVVTVTSLSTILCGLFGVLTREQRIQTIALVKSKISSRF